jgi:hypothetical protein
MSATKKRRVVDGTFDQLERLHARGHFRVAVKGTFSLCYNMNFFEGF